MRFCVAILALDPVLPTRIVVLMQWILQQWKTFLPELEKRLFTGLTGLRKQIISCLQQGVTILQGISIHNMEQPERLIRHNRYSVAILDGSESDQSSCINCLEDIFLYNGLGCRNVSNVLVSSEF